MSTIKHQNSDTVNALPAKFSFYTAIVTVLLTIFSFTIAYLTPPLSGPFCTANCFKYPYADIASRFPRDYYWMYPASILMLVYFTLMVCIYYSASGKRQIFSHIGLSFALLSTGIFVTDFFVQLTVVPQSLALGETEGIALLSQFNPHGIFIALEEIGFILMSLSMLFMAPALAVKGRLGKSIGLVFVVNFLLTITSLVIFSIIYGVNRDYLFEVAAYAFNWLTLIIAGILLGIYFRRLQRS